MMYVRLKPYNANHGHVVRHYVYKGQHYTTDTQTRRPVWYKVRENQARDLAQLHQQDSGHNSPLLFDVLTEAEYHIAVRREEDLRLVELGITTAAMAQSVPVTPRTVDLAGQGEPAGRSAALVDDMGDAEFAPSMADEDPDAAPRSAAIVKDRPAAKQTQAMSIDDDEDDLDGLDDDDLDALPPPVDRAKKKLR